MITKIALLLLFFALTIFIGLYFRKRASNVNDFVLGGRSVGPWLTAFSYGATYFSAVVFVGFAGQFGWRFGTSAVWIGLTNAFIGSLMAWFLLGRRTRIMTNHLKAATMPQFFNARYLSPALKIGASAIIFVFLIPYTASLYNGLGRLFEMAFGIPFELCIIAIGIITAIFVVAGGYFATAVNDFIQGIIMIFGIVAVIVVALNSQGGFVEATTKLSQIDATNAGGPFAQNPGAFTSMFGPNPIDLLGVVILTSLGAWGLPQMVARFYSIKSEKMITKGAIVSTIFSILIAGGSYFLGSFGRVFAATPEAAALAMPEGRFDSIIPGILESIFSNNDLMMGLIIVLVFAASISTLSSLVMTSSSTLTLDFLKGVIIKKMNDRKQLIIIRVLIVVFIVISSALAISQYNSPVNFIAQLMGISWGALAGAFLAPFLFGLYWKRTTKIAVWCNFVFSTCLMLLLVVLREGFPELLPKVFPTVLHSPINAGAFCMLAGLIIVPLVSLFTKAPDKKAVDHCFAAYEVKVLSKAGKTLGE
ncbi:MAG: sodium/solute symporter [Oscillospiraceae bacterium]|jgi:SSS family solute:Na+ symporter|nr:sodium/solute symporter [Oscillospiraceae bacterium]